MAPVEVFKEQTLRKLRDLRCPDHHQPPRLRFHGSTLRDITIQMTACCSKCADLANRKIAEPLMPHPEPRASTTALQPRPQTLVPLSTQVHQAIP